MKYISNGYIPSTLVKKWNQLLVRKSEINISKDFITCLKLIINKNGRCLAGADNTYFANNGQASLAILTSAFCFAHAQHNLIKLTLLYSN